MIWLIIFLLFCPTVYAGQSELLKAQVDGAKKGIVLTAKDTTNLLERGWRDRREGEKLFVTDLSKPKDYESAIHRGTVEYVKSKRNYSFLKVAIKDGAQIVGKNFGQIYPNYDVFDRTKGLGHNLIFKDCNLVNVKTYPDWEIINCNTAQIYRKGQIRADGDYEITDDIYIAKSSDEIKIPVEPEGVLK